MRKTSSNGQDLKTFYEDAVADPAPDRESLQNSLEAKSSAKNTEYIEREHLETGGSLGLTPTDDEKDFMIILENTCKAYGYALVEEYMMSLLKHYGMGEYIPKYIGLLKRYNISPQSCIIELGESSLQRFLINKEKRVYQFPPKETDDLMIVRDGECGSQLKLNKKQQRKVSFNCYYNPKQVEVINETIENCNEILTSVRKKANRWDTVILLYLLIGMTFAAVVGFCMGYFVHFAPAVVIALMYISGIFLLLWLSKRNAHELLLSSHL